LTFLVRDWQFEYETAYGFDGGEEILSDRLKVDFILSKIDSDKKNNECTFRFEKINIVI